MINPVLAALAQARLRDAPMFVRWCELNAVAPCPATPVTVARFIGDCASLGAERLWPAVQQISRMHAELGLADPTLGGEPAAAMSVLADLSPPRSWPDRLKARFRTLPYDVQSHIASHETQRERALRHAQNEAAAARRALAVSGSSKEKCHADEATEAAGTGGAD